MKLSVTKSLVSAICLSVVLVACQSRPKAIADLVRHASETNQHQSDSPSKTVVISGLIVRRVPLVNGAAYLVEDETSAIWVRTDQAPAETEGEVVVSGTLEWVGGEPLADERSANGLQAWFIREQTREPVEASP